ncbi:MAG: hypothetical protein U1C74_07680 [Phenylobacterium sp.]|nr:hypothetical protein [Phenylobacterium sp.]
MAEETSDEKTPPKESNALNWVGCVVTFLWIIALVSYYASRNLDFADLAPNELGDFAAGAFAPLAFFWLVLGFFQQGRELRHSGRALWLQGEELRNSVEQQRELVNVTREQLRFDSDMLRAQKEEAWRASQPLFRVDLGSYTAPSPNGERLYTITYTNVGKSCTDLSLHINGTPVGGARSAIQTGAKDSFNIRHNGTDVRMRFVIEFTDERLVRGASHWDIGFEDGDFFSTQELVEPPTA